MATIKIKGRLEPVRISNERAKELKILLWGNPATQAPASPKTDRVDFGIWEGELSQIGAIDLDYENKLSASEVFTESDLNLTEKEIYTFKAKKFKKMPESKAAARIVYSVELYMKSRDVIRIDDFGYITITDIGGYNAIERRHQAILARRGRRDFGKLKGLSELAAGMKMPTAA